MNTRKTTKIRSQGSHMNRTCVNSVFESWSVVPLSLRRSKVSSSSCAPAALRLESTLLMSPTSSTSSQTTPEEAGR
jgi:hypothetical protein